MLRTRMLARLVIPALVATTLPTLVAGEPVGTTPPAASIHEWKPKPIATPTADSAATPAANSAVTPAASIHEWKSKPIATPAANSAATPAASIHEWKTKPIATPAANSAVTPAVSAAVPTSPITFSITSTMRRGNLVVVLDDVPIFNEKFQKPFLVISQTTKWDPLQVTAGKHRLSAKVSGTTKTYFSATFDLDVSSTKGGELRFLMKGDKLTVEVAS